MDLEHTLARLHRGIIERIAAIRPEDPQAQLKLRRLVAFRNAALEDITSEAEAHMRLLERDFPVKLTSGDLPCAR